MVRYYRKVIHISAEDSPNVRLAKAQLAVGQEPTGEVVLPGILPWADYVKRVTTWDEVRICIGIKGQFWEGADSLLYPPTWLNRAEAVAEGLRHRPRKARGIGVDPGEGGDATALAASDEYGLLDLVALSTPDTSVIPGLILAFMRKHGVPADRVCIDRGGGGKQHADFLRQQGHDVRTVAFGESVKPPHARGMASRRQVRAQTEDRYVYMNRRAELYGTLRVLLEPPGDPASPPSSSTEASLSLPSAASRGWGIPREYTELRRQLSLFPLRYDGEGRLYLPPKRRKGGQGGESTLTELIGRSPDEADAVVLSLHAFLHQVHRPRAGVLF